MKQERTVKGYTFINESKGTRTGFCHITHLFDDYGDEIATARANYINRTWESYPFRTTMKNAVYEAIRKETEAWKEVYKEDFQIKKMTKKHQANFETLLSEKPVIRKLNAVLNEI